MSGVDVTMVRIYLHEGKGQLKPLFKYLHDESKVHGITVFRGTTGFGHSGKVHSATLVDMSLDLPVVVEFFDDPERAAPIIEHLQRSLGSGHVVSWPAKVADISPHERTE